MKINWSAWKTSTNNKRKWVDAHRDSMMMKKENSHRESEDRDIDENWDGFTACWSRTQLAGVVGGNLRAQFVFHLDVILFLGGEPQGRSSGSHPTRPQSSRSWSCTCWQGGCRHRWEGWECLENHLKAHLSQVKVSSGQEERVREMKELGDGAGSLPHTAASDPEEKIRKFAPIQKFLITHLPIKATKGITLKYNWIIMWSSHGF